jgi:hypothetical protein
MELFIETGVGVDKLNSSNYVRLSATCPAV